MPRYPEKVKNLTGHMNPKMALIIPHTLQSVWDIEIVARFLAAI